MPLVGRGRGLVRGVGVVDEMASKAWMVKVEPSLVRSEPSGRLI